MKKTDLFQNSNSRNNTSKSGENKVSRIMNYIFPCSLGAIFGSGAGFLGMSMALISLPALPLVAATAAGGAALGGVLHHFTKKKEKTHDEIQCDLIQEKFKKINSINKKIDILNLTLINDKTINYLNKYLNNSGRSRFPNLLINKIIIDDRSMTKQLFNKLLGIGLGNYKTTHLEIKNTEITGLTQILHGSIAQGEFEHINTLVLKNNKLNHGSFIDLNNIGECVKLKELDISNNQLVTNEPSIVAFKSFLERLNRNFPILNKLSINNIGINFFGWESVKDLFANFSLLEELSIQGLSQSQLKMLFESDEFQRNINLKRIEHGYKRNKHLDPLLEKRNAKINKLKVYFESSSEKPILLIILKKLALNEYVTKKLESFLSEPQLLDQLELTAKQYKYYLNTSKNGDHPANYFNENFFFDFKNHTVDLELAFKHKLHQFLNDKQKDRNFILNFPETGINYSFTDQFVKKKLLTMLQSLKEQEYTNIPIISMRDAKISSKDINDLIECGLDEFNTIELSLSRNKISNDFLKKIAAINENIFSQVKKIDLSNNSITAAGLNDLLYFASKNAIEELDISNNPIISCRPSEKEIRDVKTFFNELTHRVPSLQKLSVNNIGLSNNNIILLRPLFNILSSLNSIKLAQPEIDLENYNKLIESPGFKSNFPLINIDIGATHPKLFKKIMLEKRQILNDVSKSLNYQGYNTLLIQLLNRLEEENSFKFSDNVENLLDLPFSNTSQSFQLSNRQRLNNALMKLRFYRDLASTLNPNEPIRDFLSMKAYYALKTNNIYDYFNINNQKIRSIQDETEVLKEKYKIDLSRTISACVIEKLEFNTMVICILYGEDESVRVVNLHTKAQAAISAFELAITPKFNENPVMSLFGNNLNFNWKRGFSYSRKEGANVNLSELDIKPSPILQADSNLIFESQNYKRVNLNEVFQNIESRFTPGFQRTRLTAESASDENQIVQDDSATYKRTFSV